jgi:mitochondrial import inner membrane translocase subunit TIM22
MAERPEDCPTRIGLGLGSGFIVGGFFGAVASNWGDVPMVLRDKPWPALVRTGSVMVQYGTTLGLVGLAFSTVDVRMPCT